MTLEEAFELVDRRGCLVLNLFQLDDGSWRANVRSKKPQEQQVAGRAVVDTVFYDFGNGDTPVKAVLAALEDVPEKLSNTNVQEGGIFE